MITIISFLVFSALYILYYTSKKAMLYYSGFEKWMHKNPHITKATGLCLLTFAYIVLLFFKAIGAATLLFFVMIMVFSSLIIILKPLKKVNNVLLVAIFIVSTILEFRYS